MSLKNKSECLTPAPETPQASKAFFINPDALNNLDCLRGEKEVAKRLGQGLSTIQQWRGKGLGPRFVKVGRSVRYRESDIREYIAGLQTFQSTAESR